MKAHRGFVVLMSWAVLTLLPTVASAQARVEVPVAIGQKVWITVTGGKTIRGKVSRVTPSSIEVQSGDRNDSGPAETSIALADILRVQESDSLKNGMGNGAIALGLLGGLLGAGADSIDSAFGGSSNGSYLMLGIGAGLLSGIGIGAGVDALRLTTIYQRPERGVSIGVRPIVSAAGKGVGVQLRW